MSEASRSIFNFLSTAIKNEDPLMASAAAEMLQPLGLPVRITETRLRTHYQVDAFGRTRGVTTCVHHLFIGERQVGEWVRQSVGGYGLDRNHPEVWAAVASDSELSRYHLVVSPLLRVLGLEDFGPPVPAPE